MQGLFVLDYIILAILLISTVLAFLRGFTREVLSIANWVLSAYAALALGPYIGSLVIPYVGNQTIAVIIGYVIIFIAVMVIASLLISRLANSLQSSSIGALDRTLGIVFGALRGFVIACLGYLLLVLIVPQGEEPDWLTQARSYPAIQTGSAALLATIPDGSLPVDQKKLNDAVSKGRKDINNAGKNMLLDQIEQTVGDIKENVTGNSSDKDKDRQSEKGYKDSDRATLESLIKGVQGQD